MKKTFMLAMAAVALAGTMALTSCKKSNEDLIKEYGAAIEEVAKAQKDGRSEEHTSELQSQR